MFGYVRAPVEALDGAGRERYRAVYCGLCHTLGRRHGPLARFTLNYDFTLLAMLFAPAGAELCQRRCPAHPFQRRLCCGDCPGLELAADESVILFWRKLRDDVDDKGFFAALPARLASLALGGAYRKAARARPEFDAQVGEHLSRLRTLEAEGCPSMDRAADAFASILRATVPAGLEQNRARALGELLYHLGRWIYLIDAWDDLEEDRRRGSYNPLLARFDGAPEGAADYVRATLTHSARLMQAAFQLDDFGDWTPVLEAILYRGIPGVQEEVLSGQWKERNRLSGGANRGIWPRIRRKTDERPLQDPGRGAGGQRRGDQTGLPGAGTEVPPGQLPK